MAKENFRFSAKEIKTEEEGQEYLNERCGITELMKASKEGNLEKVHQILLEKQDEKEIKNAILKLTNISGLNAFEFSLRYKNSAEIVALFESHLEEKEIALSRLKIEMIEVIQLMKNARRAGGAANCRKIWKQVYPNYANQFSQLEVVHFPHFQELGSIRRSDDPELCRIMSDTISDDSFVVFISHRWLRPSLVQKEAHADSADNEKWKRICEGVKAYSREFNIETEKMYLWIDFSCINQDTWVSQENYQKMMRHINSLPIYVSCSDLLISVDHHEYWERGWCRLEQGTAYEFKVKRFKVTEEREKVFSISIRPENPRSGKLTSEDDRKMIRLLGALCGYTTDSSTGLGSTPQAIFEPIIQNVAEESLEIRYTLPEDIRVIQKTNLGESGESIKFICQNELTGKNFFMRILFSNQDDNKWTESFVGIMWNLVHPNIIRVYDVFDAGDATVMFEDFEEVGTDLFEMISQAGKIPEKNSKIIFRKLLQVLSFFDKYKIAHRNIKPEAIMMKKEGLDFLLTGNDFCTVDNGVLDDPCGTPNYVSPEILSSIKYDRRCDLWSAGVVLFVMLAGYPPFYHANMSVQYSIIKSGKIEFKEEWGWSNISKEAINLITNLVKVDPNERLTLEQALNHPWFSQ